MAKNDKRSEHTLYRQLSRRYTTTAISRHKKSPTPRLPFYSLRTACYNRICPSSYRSPPRPRQVPRSTKTFSRMLSTSTSPYRTHRDEQECERAGGARLPTPERLPDPRERRRREKTSCRRQYIPGRRDYNQMLRVYPI